MSTRRKWRYPVGSAVPAQLHNNDRQPLVTAHDWTREMTVLEPETEVSCQCHGNTIDDPAYLLQMHTWCIPSYCVDFVCVIISFF